MVSLAGIKLVSYLLCVHPPFSPAHFHFPLLSLSVFSLCPPTLLTCPLSLSSSLSLSLYFLFVHPPFSPAHFHFPLLSLCLCIFSLSTHPSHLPTFTFLFSLCIFSLSLAVFSLCPPTLLTCPLSLSSSLSLSLYFLFVHPPFSPAHFQLSSSLSLSVFSVFLILCLFPLSTHPSHLPTFTFLFSLCIFSLSLCLFSLSMHPSHLPTFMFLFSHSLSLSVFLLCPPTLLTYPLSLSSSLSLFSSLSLCLSYTLLHRNNSWYQSVIFFSL